MEGSSIHHEVCNEEDEGKYEFKCRRFIKNLNFIYKPISLEEMKNLRFVSIPENYEIKDICKSPDQTKLFILAFKGENRKLFIMEIKDIPKTDFLISDEVSSEVNLEEKINNFIYEKSIILNAYAYHVMEAISNEAIIINKHMYFNYITGKEIIYGFSEVYVLKDCFVLKDYDSEKLHLVDIDGTFVFSWFCDKNFQVFLDKETDTINIFKKPENYNISFLDKLTIREHSFSLFEVLKSIESNVLFDWNMVKSLVLESKKHKEFVRFNNKVDL